MEGIYVPLISALAGAFIGSATSIATILIQARRDERRHLREVAARLAMDDYKTHVDLASSQGGAGVYPVAMYLAHHLSVLEAAASGSLTVERFKEISSRDRELRQMIDDREAQKATKNP